MYAVSTAMGTRDAGNNYGIFSKAGTSPEDRPYATENNLF
jgi:hypothetical protein